MAEEESHADWKKRNDADMARLNGDIARNGKAIDLQRLELKLERILKARGIRLPGPAYAEIAAEISKE